MLLAELVAARSPSREEGPAVDVLAAWLRGRGELRRLDRNLIFVRDSGRSGPTILLLSHTDTVPATAAWTRDPWSPTVEGGRLYGLGAADAKGCVAAMAEAACTARLPRGKLVFAPVCEEETGRGGLEAILGELPPADGAIVGEPTGLDFAVSQSGLLVLEGRVRGRAGHAARPWLADNPIPRLAEDLLRLSALDLRRGDEPWTTLVPTMVQAGERHNVIPAEACYTLDLRTTPAWTHAELVERVRATVSAELTVRSDRFRPVRTPDGAHILACAEAAWTRGRRFASPTLSDWAHLALPAIKWGPGRSEQSHTADEWVDLAEVEAAVGAYRRTIELFLEG